MTKLKGKLKIENKGFDSDILNKYRDAIFSFFQDLYDNLNTDCDLVISLRKDINKTNKVPLGGRSIKKGNGFLVLIYDNAFCGDTEKDKLDNLFSVIYHEFVHVYDIINTYANNYCTFKPDVKHEQETDIIKQLGFDFWLEYRAFNMTMYKFEFIIKHNSLYKIYKQYCKLLTRLSGLNNMNNGKEKNKMVSDYVKDVDFFIYNIAITIACLHNQNKVLKRYNDKTENDKNYIFIKKLFIDLSLLCAKTHKGMFGKYQESRLEQIGKKILKLNDNLNVNVLYKT